MIYSIKGSLPVKAQGKKLSCPIVSLGASAHDRGVVFPCLVCKLSVGHEQAEVVTLGTLLRISRKSP